jgi:WD40 repeat protein
MKYLFLLCFFMNLQFSVAQQLLQYYDKQGVFLHDAALSPDAKLIVVAPYQKSALLYSAEGVVKSELEKPEGGVRTLSFSKDGKSIIGGSTDKCIIVWDLQGQQKLAFKSQEAVLEVDENASGRILAGSGRDEVIPFYFKRSVKYLPNDLLTSHRIDFAEESGHSLSIGKNKAAVLLNSSGIPVITFGKHRKKVTAVAVSVQENYYLSGSADGMLKLWENSGHLRLEIKAHDDAISALAFSPDGRFFVSGGMQGNIKIWNLRGELIGRKNAHAWCVSSLSFSENGKKLLSASWDGTAKLWGIGADVLSQLRAEYSAGK